MKIYELKDFTRGWFLGDFDPALKKTKDFEVAVKRYNSGDRDKKHHHKIADEITVIISGKFKLNNEIYGEDDIIHIQPGENVEFECLETGAIAVVKTPSVKGDKFEI